MHPILDDDSAFKNLVNIIRKDTMIKIHPWCANYYNNLNEWHHDGYNAIVAITHGCSQTKVYGC